jgi:hypothetical protein
MTLILTGAPGPKEAGDAAPTIEFQIDGDTICTKVVTTAFVIETTHEIGKPLVKENAEKTRKNKVGEKCGVGLVPMPDIWWSRN